MTRPASASPPVASRSNVRSVAALAIPPLCRSRPEIVVEMRNGIFGWLPVACCSPRFRSAHIAPPIPRRSDATVVSGMEAGNASAACPSTPIRSRLGSSMDSTSPVRWAASIAAANDCIALATPVGDGAVSAICGIRRHRSTPTPPRRSIRCGRRRRHARRQACRCRSDGRYAPGSRARTRQALAVRLDQRQGHFLP